MQEEIISKIKQVVGDDIEIRLDRPSDPSHGDFTTNVALSASKKLDKNPLDLAAKIRTELGSLSQIEKVEVAGPGFINLFLKKENLIENLKRILSEGDNYGKSDSNHGKKVVVEYSSPNIAKPFTVGHLRSTIIGDAIANLLVATGWEVVRDNHLGDWGTQFGKQIYAIKAWGDEDKISKAENPVKELVALYVRFHEEAEKDESLEDNAREWFKKLEEGDSEAKRIWKFCIELSKKEFERIYSELGVKFDTEYGESFYEDKMGTVVSELESKKLLKEDEGARLVYFENDKFPPLMIIKSDGTTLYATRDLATDKFRIDTYGKDAMIINEVGIEQSLYFNQLFELEKMLGWIKQGQRVHIRHGLYRFADSKMSTRKGNTIWLEDVLEEAKKRASAKEVGIGALKWNDLKRNSQQDIVFDWEDVLNMQGNSGPYMQYTYARTQSVLGKKKASEFNQVILEKEEEEILRMLDQFVGVVSEAAEKFAPNILCLYLFELAQKYNLFYQKYKIIDSDKEDFRLNLTDAVGQVIKNGLKLLGISAPEKM